MKTMSRSAWIFRLLSLSFAGALMVGLSSSAVAQGSSSKGADSLRALNATPAEVAEGKSLTDASCHRCHGNKGISTTKGTPHLAGQRAPYLYLELKAYQSGLRPDKSMSAAVKFLSNDALTSVAAYYASLDPPPPVSAKAVPAMPDPIQAGRTAASGCAGCHGESGVSETGGVPNLVGIDPKFLVVAMKAYKSGGRKHEMMTTLLADVAEPSMENIALYYGLQKPVKAKTPSPGDQGAGKAAAADCGGCHGDKGVSGNPTTPSLAGQDAEYFVEALKAYKNKLRNDDTMRNLTAAMDDKTMKNLAAYYANLQPKAPKVKKPLTTAEVAQKCDRCHGLNGNSTNPRIPALAAQRTDYMEAAMRSYRKGERKNSSMAAMAYDLSDAEIDSLAIHYAQQKARAVVFITTPAN